ncbi:mannose-1-phosphate guanylyltransferase, partial [Prochlorococcus sp. AH-736-L15]
MEIKKNIIPILLCGGSGTRLWPLSRDSFPKQYLSKNKEENNSFLQMTIKRLSKIPNLGKIIVVCNEQHRFITAEQIRSMNIKDSSIILEPVKRNTTPAIALAALKSIEKGEDNLLLVLPTDHLINNEKVFCETIKAAEKDALKDKLITFGILPKSPETGFGYIKAKKNLDYKKISGSEIDRFIEKPNKSLATKFIRDKRFSWNSGMFMFKASTILGEIKKYAPDIISYCVESLKNIEKDLYFERIN